MSIYDDTPIIPEIIADNVAIEASNISKRDGLPGLSEHLSAKAETIYKANKRFRKQMNASGNRGRDTLYMFMRHWAAAWMFENRILRRSEIPYQFSNGKRVSP